MNLQFFAKKTEVKNVYKSIKEAPKYPQGFVAKKGGTYVNKINNQDVIDMLRNVESGTWKKIYKNGYDTSGNKISIHFFQSKSGSIFDVKVKNG